MTETTLDRYLLGEKIGSGGMGNVYRGVDRGTNTPVAIKELKSELASPQMVQRFVREGEALRQLNHPNIVKLLDAVHQDGCYYLIMELVEGGSLDAILERTPRLPLNQVLNIALDLADALTRAHRLNIIHRDIKPANVLLAQDGMLRLTDFGIARVIDSNITETGSVLGTLAYIAPEVLHGKQADARSDIWSMGMMLFEMLTGVHPFKADQQAGGMIYAILNANFPDLEALRPDAPPALVDVIMRMLMKEPAERIPRMRLVGAELEAILAKEPPPTSPAVVSATVQATQVVLEIVPASRFETPPATSPDTVRHNLPLQTTPFVGRETELGELENILCDGAVRLLTILGPGGMGKTRLSLEVGGKLLHATGGVRQFEHGVFFVDLAPLVSAEHIVGAASDAVGYVFQQDGREARQQLLDYLREKHMLLIMDNFEHVTAGRTLVQDILQTANGVKILVTSREKLNLSSETVYVLSGMQFPTWETPADALEYGAVKLFMQSALRVRRDFRLDADSLSHVARICRMVQGTPLGILLAASWLEALTPREIVDEISRSLDFLETDLHDLPERQRSLRAVFEYSWDLLAEPERDLFAHFSLFRGGFTRDAALQITGTNLRALTTLVNKSLLRRDNVSGRYEIHELLRQFAEEKLAQSSDLAAVNNAYSRYYLELVTQLTPKLKGFGQLEALNLIDTDFENIRAAWNWAVQERNAATVEAALEGLFLYLTFRSRIMDGDQMFGLARQAWSAAGEAPPLLAGRLLVRFPDAPPLERYRRGLEIARQHGDAFEIAFCQRPIGHWLSHTEFNHDEGIPLLQASVNGFQALGDRFYAAQGLDDLGWSYALTLDIDHQLPVVQQSLALRREIGDKIGIGNSLRNMGGASGGFFDTTEQAFKYWGEAKAIAYEMNDRLQVAWNASLQAANLIYMGEFERALPLLDEAYPHAVNVNDAIVKGFIQLQRSAIATMRDEDYASARRLIDETFPPNSPADFRVAFGSFALSVLACGLHDFSILRPYLKLLLVDVHFRSIYFMPMLLSSRVVQLADHGEYRRAAELLFNLSKFLPTFANSPFPMGWSQRWKLFVQIREQIMANLNAGEREAIEAQHEDFTEADIDAEVAAMLEDLRR